MDALESTSNDIPNLDATIDSLAGELGLTDSPATASPPAQDVKDGATPAVPGTPSEPKKYDVPKSWKPEYHADWGKMDPRVQEYWLQRESEMEKGVEPLKADAAFAKSIRDVINPYRPLLDAQKVTEADAIRYLMNGHYQLMQNDEAKKFAFVRELFKSYGIDEKKLVAALGVEAPITDPSLQPIIERQNALEKQLKDEQEAKRKAEATRVATEVEAFAKDPNHPYFDEVADDIVILMRGDPNITLDKAYDKAVYANPVTRAKELARLQQQAGEDARKKAEEEAKKAEAAKGTQLRGRESSRSPQEPTGSMDDTLNETLKSIKARVS